MATTWVSLESPQFWTSALTNLIGLQTINWELTSITGKYDDHKKQICTRSVYNTEQRWTRTPITTRLKPHVHCPIVYWLSQTDWLSDWLGGVHCNIRISKLLRRNYARLSKFISEINPNYASFMLNEIIYIIIILYMLLENIWDLWNNFPFLFFILTCEKIKLISLFWFSTSEWKQNVKIGSF